MDPRIQKRWKREHAKRNTYPRKATHLEPGEKAIELVYRPKTEEERQKVAERKSRLLSTSFIELVPKDQKECPALSFNGQMITWAEVEQVFNDALLMNGSYGYGEDGAPLYEDTINGVMQAMLEIGKRRAILNGLEVPEQYGMPEGWLQK